MTTDTNKRSFDFKRTDHFLCDPSEDLRIIGGLVLPMDERGPLDTEEDTTHPLHDPRLRVTLSEAFVRNVDAFGVKVPIQIVKLDDYACVVEGRRRVRGARIANARRLARGEPPIKVPSIIQRTKDDRSLLTSMITLNEARLDDEPLAKLAKLKRLLDRGVSPADAAVTFNVDERTIEAWLRFDDLAIDAVKEAVDSGRLSLSAGGELAKLKDPAKQQEALTAALVAAPAGSKVSAAKVKRAARELTKPGSVGAITSRRTMGKLLEAVRTKEHRANTSETTVAWWEGVEAALAAIVGDEKLDERLTKIITSLGGYITGDKPKAL